MARSIQLVAVTWLALVAPGCVDIRAFEGSWRGSIIAEPAVRQGFAADAEVTALELRNVTLQGLRGRLTTSDGKFDDTSLMRINKTASDALASLSFEGDPLRSYLMFGPVNETTAPMVPDAGPALLVVSFFADDHAELRILRGNDLFGVFYLLRAP